jgi:hypothetical protein
MLMSQTLEVARLRMSYAMRRVAVASDNTSTHGRRDLLAKWRRRGAGVLRNGRAVKATEPTGSTWSIVGAMRKLSDEQ